MNNNERLKKFLARKNREAAKKKEKTYISTLDKGINKPCKRMLTGLLTVDYLLNGIMEGSLYEISGAEGAGKSTLCWKILEKLQYIYPGISIYYNDIEGTSKDEAFLNRFPLLKRDEVVIDANVSIESFFGELEEMGSLVDLIFVDTVAVLDLENKVDMQKAEMGKVAGMFTRGWKRFHDVSRNGIRMIAINQLRDNLEMYAANHGPKTPGGRAYHYALTGQIGIKRDGGQSKAEKEKDIFGNDKVKSWNTVITIFKNKQGPFGKSINTVLNTTEEGEEKFTTFDEIKELIAFSKVFGFIEEQGRQMYTVLNLSDGTEREKIRGNEALEYYIKNNIDVFIELKINVYRRILDGNFFYSLYDKILMIARAEKVMYEIRKQIDWNTPIQVQLNSVVKPDDDEVLEEIKNNYPISLFFTPEQLEKLNKEYGEPWTWKLRERVDDEDEEIEE